MKVLYVGADAQVCGAGFSMVRLVEELDKLGIDVVPVVHHGNSERLLSEKKINHYIVDAWSWSLSNQYSSGKRFLIMTVKKLLNIPCYFQYLKIIKKENPDIIHVNALTTYVIVQAALKMKKPVVWHIREMMEEDLNSSFWNKKEAYSLMKKADCLIAISQCVENKYKMIVSEEKIKCIYNGIDVNRFLNIEHEILKSDKVLITMAGRITKSKGQLLCLKSLIPILQSNDNVILQFAGVGDENEINEMIALRNNAGLTEEQVKLLGFVEDMERLWSETDIAVVYSKFEAFGRVTVEAKMAGALVVGYNSGGTTELIEDGVDGYLFDDSNMLREIMNTVLANRERTRQIAKRGRERAAAVFTSEKNATEVRKVYKEVLGGD